MANNSNRIYLSREQAEQIVRELDEKRQRAIADPTMSALLDLVSVAQWVTHQDPLLTIHQKQWKEREQ